jgi:pyrroloquinoline-quinone synthase
LNHPFYVAWTKGELTGEQLAQYAAQYMHYVLAEPTFLSAAHSNTPTLQATAKSTFARANRPAKSCG